MVQLRYCHNAHAQFSGHRAVFTACKFKVARLDFHGQNLPTLSIKYVAIDTD